MKTYKRSLEFKVMLYSHSTVHAHSGLQICVEFEPEFK